MSNYPEMDKQENIITTKATDNKETITKTYNTLKEQSSAIINDALTNKVNKLKKQLNQVPQIYKNLRNNLTNTNNKAKKNMEENIANTGNHTASGYAISKRMNNQNEYNKELTNIDTSEQAHISDINEQIADAYFDSETEKSKMITDYDYKMLQDIIKEQDRVDTFNYNLEKDNFALGETKRLNDHKIAMETDENTRENEKHKVDMKYQPELYQAELDGMYKENALTDAKITATKSSGSSGSSGSSSNSGGSKTSTVTSKMSAKDIAENIKSQIGLLTYDHNGKEIYVFDEFQAYMFLDTWRKKFGLSDQVVNDAAIYLGIQDFL